MEIAGAYIGSFSLGFEALVYILQTCVTFQINIWMTAKNSKSGPIYWPIHRFKKCDIWALACSSLRGLVALSKLTKHAL